ncbi:MAG: DUF4974 domain-containing protein [Carboxylicivirga sp.]|jgi:ferric-dicitrate binding protein FerR (iron transport regulator)|nr:DUF4974 domain-containing protein [Carboxylicivirga sp.]
MQNEERHIDAILLTKFIAGEASKEEQLQVIEWLEADQANQAAFDQLEESWVMSGRLDPQPLPVDVPDAWGMLNSRIDSYEQKEKSLMRFIRPAIYVAASIIVAVLLFNISRDEQSTFTPISVENLSHGQKTDTLPDGSIVTLNAGSRLVYLSKSDDMHRRMTLEGEAFFDVVRDTLRPFVIKAGMGGVRVLGTSFNVKITNTTDVTVDVESGLVELFYPVVNSSDTLRLELNPGERGQLSHQSSQLKSQQSSSSSFFWLDNTLIFKNKPLQDVFEVLEQCYHVQINCDDNNILLTNLSTTFKNKELNEVLDVIAATFDIAYQQQGKTYRIYRP